MIAAKNPVWLVEKHEDFEKYLDEELKRLGTDYIDVYLLHNLNHDNWENVKRYDGLTFLDKMVRKGKIRHKAFSIHNTLDAFKEIVNIFDWEMAQIQLNILDEHRQVGVEGLRYAAKKGIAVVVMEPLRGGSLVTHVPQEVSELVETFPHKRSLVDWCFRWLYNMPEVSVVLSGTSSLEQLKDNLRIFDDAYPDTMSDEELGLIRQIQQIYESNSSIGCTGCAHCMPCPQDVSIPEIFKLYNSYALATDHKIDAIMYQDAIVPNGKGADRCVACGHCEAHCPQELNISQLLKDVHTAFSS
jgi:predicted aldo/keto reductase-like oxidoreductase